MKKRLLAVLMALSLVSSSALSDSGSITVSAEAISEEPVTEETENISSTTDIDSEENGSDVMTETEQSDESQSGSESASSAEQHEEAQSNGETSSPAEQHEEAQGNGETSSSAEQSEETQSGSETSSSSAESMASSEDSPEEENQGNEETVTEQNNENIDESEADSNNTGSEDSVPSETQEANTADNEELDVEKNESKDTFIGDDYTIYEKNQGYDDYVTQDSPWLVDYEYTVDEDNKAITLYKNVSFTYGNGLLIIPSMALINGKEYEVIINLSPDFFCNDARENAKAVFWGSSYIEALNFLQNQDGYLDSNYIDTTFAEIARFFYTQCSNESDNTSMYVGSENDVRGNGSRMRVIGEARESFANFNANYYCLINCDFSEIHDFEGLFKSSRIQIVDENTFNFCDIREMVGYNYMFSHCNNLNIIRNIVIGHSHCHVYACNMFEYCENLYSVEMRMWGNCFVYSMFDNAGIHKANITGVDESIDESCETQIYASAMFSNCKNLESAYINNVKVRDIQNLFKGCPKIDRVSFKDSIWLLPESLSEFHYLMIHGDGVSAGATQFDYEAKSIEGTYSTNGKIEYPIFDTNVHVSTFGSFMKIETNEIQPYIYLGGGLYRAKNAINIFSRRCIDVNTTNNVIYERDTSNKKTISFMDDNNNVIAEIDYSNPSLVDILPAITIDERELSGWFTRLYKGIKISLLQSIKDTEPLTLYGAFQYPYEIKYNSEMPTFINRFTKDQLTVSTKTWLSLMHKLSPVEYNWLLANYDGWHQSKNPAQGICFGVSAAQITDHTMGLSNNKKVHQLDSQNKEDSELITLYQLGQYTADFLKCKYDYLSYSDTERIKRLVDRAKEVETNGPAMFNYYVDGVGKGEHAVVIDGYESVDLWNENVHYTHKIKVYNIESGEGIYAPDELLSISIASQPEDYDIYVSQDYSFFTNISQHEFNTMPQTGDMIIAVYDDVIGMNYFDNILYMFGDPNANYNMIYAAYGKIRNVVKKIGGINGNESDNDIENYFIDNFDEDVIIDPEADGVEFTYCMKNKCIKFKSDTNAPVSITYYKDTDDYEIRATSGNCLEVKFVNNNGVTWGSSIKGTTEETGKAIIIKTQGSSVFVDSESEIKADFFVDEKQEKIATITAREVYLTDSDEEKNVVVKLDTDNDNQYDGRVIEINYAGEDVTSINDTGSNDVEISEEPSTQNGDNEGHNNQATGGNGESVPTAQESGDSTHISQNDTGSSSSVETLEQSSIQNEDGESQKNLIDSGNDASIPSAHESNDSENGENVSSVHESSGSFKSPLSVGTEFTSAGKVYRVNGEKTVTFIKAKNKKAKTISIPSNVVYENQTYSVTEVKAKACKGMKKLKSVTIPSSVKKIGSKAFYNCPNLKKVTVKANSALTIGKSSFKKVNKDCTIKVKGLKKKAKTSMIKKIKKQTNGKVK